MKLSEETWVKLDELQEKYNNECMELIANEARKNNPYSIGDIIQDHFQTGRISKTHIGIDTNKRSYSLSYVCERLTKGLKPFKSGEDCVIYGANIIKTI